MNVLVVDNDRILAKLVVAEFKKLGNNVIHKTTAQTGVDGIDEIKPHVIILEIQLAGHNGVEFINELRSHAEWQHISLIIFTKNINALKNDFKRAWRSLGVTHVFYKPETEIKKLILAAENLFAPA